MIGVDWGTSSLRAWRLGRDGAVIEARASARGIMTIPEGGFAAVLREIVADWLAAGETQVLLCGMVGSRQGWVEAPYLPCPAGIEEIAARLIRVEFADAEAMIVPGLVTMDGDGVPDVMRGEETQILGVAADAGARITVCLPGTHSKWAVISGGRIERFSTFMTGEVFAALSAHTILARTIRPGPVDPAAFADGVARAREPGGLLHHAFGVRTRALRRGIGEAESYAYLSGLLIGHELNAALDDQAGVVAVVGASALADLYVAAIRARGGEARAMDEATGAIGLAQLGMRAKWS